MCLGLTSYHFFLLYFIVWVGLLDTDEKKEAFKAKYGIPTGVAIEHCEVGEHYTRRALGVVANPMIAFIEGGMRIRMDRVMRDFLLFLRISPSQCSINLF